jgi:hypothetical protein
MIIDDPKNPIGTRNWKNPGRPGRCETLWSWQGGVEAAEKLLGKDDLFDPEDDDLRWMRWGVYPLVI